MEYDFMGVGEMKKVEGPHPMLSLSFFPLVRIGFGIFLCSLLLSFRLQTICCDILLDLFTLFPFLEIFKDISCIYSSQ